MKTYSCAMMCVMFGLGGCGYVGIEVLERVEPEDKEDAGAGGSSTGGGIATGGVTTTGAVVSAGGTMMDAGMMDASVDAGPPPCIVTCDPSLYDNVETLSCDVDHCLLDNCANGYGDCDGLLENGCELSTSTLIDCGGCGVVCDTSIYPQVTAVICDLDEEACAPTGCQSGFHDCDGLPGNGCEATFTSAEHCGACDSPCDAGDYDHVAEVSCTGTACILVACEDGFEDCNNDLSDGCESDLNNDVDTCGGCGNLCSESEALMACNQGICEIAGCNPGYGDCDGFRWNGCETSLDTLSDCGTCGTACDAYEAVMVCNQGACEIAQCNSGYGDCTNADGCETPLNTLSDCGACGVPCTVGSGTPSCSGGNCSNAGCTAPNADCDSNPLDCETDLHTLANCGACNATCGPLAHATATCGTGSCQVDQCDSGYGNCDTSQSNGCETALTSLTNCGACGQPCSVSNGTASCSTGTCTATGCTSPYDDCDSDPFTCETNLQSLTDCGGCGVACGPLNHASATCATGDCKVNQCNAGWGNCDGIASNGCETDLNTDNNCGQCGKTCPGGGQCVNGACPGFHYNPSNFDDTLVDSSGAPDVVFNCGTTKFDSSTQQFTNACGNTLPTPIVTSQTTGGGLQIVILEFNNIQVSSGNTLQIVGNKPVVIVAFGDATIAGTVDSNASGITPGAGGDLSCGSSAGQNGVGDKDTGAGGGGGGGFGTKGGDGGDHGFGDPGGAGGVLRGTDNLSPLLAGCLGGVGGGCSSNKGGGGGGAVQFSVVGTLSVTGTVRANGGVGTNGCSTEGGGGGGGSGGGILLEADVLQISGNVTANGGAGGDGRSGGRGGAGGTGTATARNGQDESANGAGGGGGAVGRAYLRGIASCSIGGTVSAKTLTSCP